jgi:ribosomal protein S18 acetylase RimI-like enzyme
VTSSPARTATTIRRATDRDVAELADQATQLGYPVDRATMRRRLARVGERDDAVLLVAVDAGDKAIGWIQVALLELLVHDDMAAIEGLVVDQRHRSRGIGEALVAAGEAWARERGATEITVRSRSTRERAHRFYERIGYVEIKRSHVFAKPLR